MGDIKQQEQKRMNQVIVKIKAAQKKDQKDLHQANADKAAIQADFKNNVRIKTTTYSGMMETALTLRQQQQLLQERENSWQQAKRRLDVLAKLEKKPYFARIDFQENGEAKAETLYLGLGTFSDENDNILIYDWRAPISSVYYDGKLGKVSYETPEGSQEVELTLKRQFMVEDGTIITLYDTDETVGDQMLLEVLDEASDVKMKSIVTTIQKEQNKIIRDTDSELLFVQGAAGSGKTSAVLQRIAFLLYRYRGKLTSSQVILFSPNQLFNDYIDQVLPELGEQNMVQLTYYQYTQRRVPKLKIETLQERFEQENQVQQATVKQFKESLAFFNATLHYTNYLEQAGMRFKNIMYRGEIFFSKEKIKEIYYSFNENYHLKQRLEATKEELLKQLNHRVNKEAKSDRVQKAIQELSQQELNALYGDRPKSFANGDKELQFLARSYVMRDFMAIKTAIVKNRFLNINAQYMHFLKNVPNLIDLSKHQVTLEQWQVSLASTKADLQNKRLSVNDATVYLNMYDRIIGKKGQLEIKQVFIDEIQDYTPYQLAYLKQEFPRAKFTMLGDLNQAIFTKENSRSLLKDLTMMFPKEKTKVVQLTKSYRSTKQITDFTREVLINGAAVEAFERAGELPTISYAKSKEELIAKLVTQLQANEHAQMTTAIVAKTLAESEMLNQALKQANQKATLISTENQRLAQGTIIVPAFLAKGLEFDAIIMWDANAKNYGREDERQLVYTICSRAMHRLSILVTEQLSPLLAQINPSLYKVQ